MRWREILREIERIPDNGMADDDLWTKHQSNDHFHPKQPDLFPDLPGTYRAAGKIGSLIVVQKAAKGDKDREWVLFDGERVAGYLSAHPEQPRWPPIGSKPALRIKTVRIDRAFKGRGLAVEFYAWMLGHVCPVILADDMQTDGGAAIWRKLVTDRRFAVAVCDTQTWQSKGVRSPKGLDRVYDYDHLQPYVMLRGARRVAEAVDRVDVLAATVTVLRDPSPQQVAGLVQKHERVRGIAHAGTYYVWDGYAAVHFQIEAHYGLTRRDCGEFAITMHAGEDDRAQVWLFQRGEEMLRDDGFQRLLSALPWDAHG